MYGDHLDLNLLIHSFPTRRSSDLKLVPNNPASPVTLQQAIDGEPQLQDMRRQDPEVAGLMDRALKLEGLYRHASTHAAGVVIGARRQEARRVGKECVSRCRCRWAPDY